MNKILRGDSEIAAYLRLGLSTVRRELSCGLIPHRRIGRLRLATTESLDLWLAGEQIGHAEFGNYDHPKDKKPEHQESQRFPRRGRPPRPAIREEDGGEK